MFLSYIWPGYFPEEISLGSAVVVGISYLHVLVQTVVEDEYETVSC